VYCGQCGGLDCVCDILCNGGRSGADNDASVTRLSEQVCSEAAGVVAQVTSPSLVVSAQVHDVRHDSLVGNLADLVPALTGTIHPSSLRFFFALPRARFGVERIGQLIFPANCHKRQLNQGFVVLYLF